jgi:pteridine reductase
MLSENRQVALVTGAAQRLGACMVRTLHAKGYDVIVHYHGSRPEALALTAELNELRPGSATTLCCDFSVGNPAKSLIKSAGKVWSRLDLLVNNASIFDETPVNTIEVSTWDRIQMINLRTPYFLSIAAAPMLGKTGLVAVTRSLAVELAPAVRVNCVSPGAILWAPNESETARKETIEKTPLKRHGRPEDIAQAVCFLAESNFITGHTINVDGGRVVRN